MAVQDVFEALNTRIKSPYFGYALLAFLALNWRGIFVLFATEGLPLERLAAFDSHTDIKTLLAYPFVFGGVTTILSPWIKYLFGAISQKPLQLMNNLQLEIENTRVIREAELEKTRTEMFAGREQELIDRAKRDESLAELDEDVQEELKEQINELRKERDDLSSQLKQGSSLRENTIQLDMASLQILKAAKLTEDGRIIIDKTVDGPSISIGKIVFGQQGARIFVEYERGLDSLVSQGLIKAEGIDETTYKLTADGWNYVETL